MSAFDNQNQPIFPVRRRGPQPPAQEPYLDAEVARGQSDAVLGALGRMQLRLDLLARQQSEALDHIYAELTRISARLDEFEVGEVGESDPASD